MPFLESKLFTFGILPLLIFLARVVDVSLGTIRIVFVTRERRFLAPLVGFFEVLIWLLAVARVMQNLDNVFCYVAYAGGFAVGNYVGIRIEQTLAMGTVLVRVITRKDASELIKKLRGGGYGVTTVPAHGSSGRVSVIYSLVKRASLEDVIRIIKKCNPNAFYSVEDIRFVTERRTLWSRSRRRRTSPRPPALRRHGK